LQNKTLELQNKIIKLLFIFNMLVFVLYGKLQNKTLELQNKKQKYKMLSC